MTIDINTVCDFEVDLLCVGSGEGALAAAISAAKANLSVLFAKPPPARRNSSRTGIETNNPWIATLAQRSGIELLDDPAVAYFDAITSDLGAGKGGTRSHDHARFDLYGIQAHAANSQGVPPFFGSALRTWAYECLRSTNGVLSTSVAIPGRMDAVAHSGETLVVADVGTLPEYGLYENGLHDWLVERAHEQGIRTNADTTLHRLLFDDHDVIGAVVVQQNQHRVVRARYGAVVGIGARSVDTSSTYQSQLLPSGTRLCLMSRYASRFGRLGLVSEQDMQNLHQPVSTRQRSVNLDPFRIMRSPIPT